MTEELLNVIVSKMKKLSVQTCRNIPFSGLTTLGVGGTIKLVVYPDSKKRLLGVLKTLYRLKAEYVVLGKGSNVLASDNEYDGVVVVNRASGVTVRGRTVTALSGTPTVTLSKQLQLRGLSGGEFTACLPATVGGAVVSNAGCYGQCVADVLTSVTVFYKGRVRVIRANKCEFSKRSSLFKRQKGYTVLSAAFRFTKSCEQAVKNRIAEMREQKARTQPLNYRSAGCVLYHDKVAVSRLLDKCGLKGYTVGGAQVSAKHAGFVVNVDKATGGDIYLVIRRMTERLRQDYGIQPKLEVELVNFSKEEYDFFSKR